MRKKNHRCTWPRRAPLPGDAVGPLGHDPLGVLADQLDVGLAEPGLLAELAPCRLERALARLQPTLGQLPLARHVGPLERQHTPVAAASRR